MSLVPPSDEPGAAAAAPLGTTRSTLTWADGLAVLLFLALATAHVMGRWQGRRPFYFLTGDAAVYAGMAAAADHPELFTRDEMLSDPRSTTLYRFAVVPLARLAERVCGDYGTAFIVLLGPTVFLHLAGFYVLGRALFAQRFFAVLLALITFPLVSLHMTEYWGVHRDVQPRVLFQAIWPFVMAAAVHWSGRPGRWPVLMAATGVLAFVHPVSTPAVALSLWLGFWACLPPAWPTGRRCRHMALTAAAFLVSVAPYAILYLSGHAHGRASDPEIQRLVTYGAWNMVDVGGAARQFLAALWRLHVYVFLAVAGIVFTHRLGDRRRVAMVLLWAAGVVGASVVVPAAVRAYARYAGTLPLESQLTRNLRYLLPLILLFTLWPLAEWSRRTAREAWWRAVPLGLGIALTANWWDGHPPTDVVRNALRCWSRGRLLCPGTKYDRTEEAMEAVKRVVPEGVPIVTTRLEGQFRYATLRPLAYAYKHHEQFIYSNHERLREWDRKRRRMERALASATPRDRLRRLVKFAARCEAGFLLVHFRVRSGDLQGLPASLAWSNGQYSLVKLTAGTH